ncbi:unnamed protein product [Amoebophrya sp. A120]|nr:unnamed protein product [Amoebophrya sp. A120]|eukprot:GSA120T00005774001.1
MVFFLSARAKQKCCVLTTVLSLHALLVHASMPIHDGWFWLLLGLAVFNYLATALSDPGYVGGIPSNRDTDTTPPGLADDVFNPSPTAMFSTARQQLLVRNGGEEGDTRGVIQQDAKTFNGQHVDSRSTAAEVSLGGGTRLSQNEGNYTVRTGDGSSSTSSAGGASATLYDATTTSQKWCSICNCEQALRTKHCRDCQRCVRTHDHHCPWVDSCVGEGNRAFFFAFILFQFLETALCMSHVVRRVVLSTGGGRDTDMYSDADEEGSNSLLLGEINVVDGKKVEMNRIDLDAQYSTQQEKMLDEAKRTKMLMTEGHHPDISSSAVRGALLGKHSQSYQDELYAGTTRPSTSGMVVAQELQQVRQHYDALSSANHGTSRAQVSPTATVNDIALLLVLAIIAFALFLLFCTHVYLISANLTTYEMTRRHRVPYLQNLRKGSPFSEGCFQNWAAYLLLGRTPCWRASPWYRRKAVAIVKNINGCCTSSSRFLRWLIFPRTGNNRANRLIHQRALVLPNNRATALQEGRRGGSPSWSIVESGSTSTTTSLHLQGIRSTGITPGSTEACNNYGEKDALNRYDSRFPGDEAVEAPASIFIQGEDAGGSGTPIMSGEDANILVSEQAGHNAETVDFETNAEAAEEGRMEMHLFVETENYTMNMACAPDPVTGHITWTPGTAHVPFCLTICNPCVYDQ